MSLAQVFDLTGTKVVKFCWLFFREGGVFYLKMLQLCVF